MKQENMDKQFNELLNMLSIEELFVIAKNFVTRQSIIRCINNTISIDDKSDVLECHKK